MNYASFSAKAWYFSLALGCLFLIQTLAVQAAEVRISQNLSDNQSIVTYRVSPDGKYAVYEVDQTQDFNTVSRQLFSVNIATREVKALTAALTGDRSIQTYLITPNSARVIFLADLGTLFRYELYSIGITGGSSTKISRALPTGNNSRGFFNNVQVSPDGTRVVYNYEESFNEGESIDALYSNSITGGSSARLSTLTRGADVYNYIFTPDGKRVVFEYIPTASSDVNAQIYSVPTTGGTPVLVAEKYLGEYAVTSDSKTFVTAADYDNDFVSELYSSPVAGGARTQLSLPNEEVSNFKLPAGFSAVVYSYKMTNEQGFTPNSFGIVSTDARNRYALRIGKDISGFSISPDNRGIVFTADEQNSDGLFQSELFSVTLDSRGAVRKLSDGGMTRGVADYRSTPDGSRVVFLASPINAFGTQLYSVPTMDGGVTKLSNVTYGDIFAGVQNTFQFTPDGKRVVFPYSAQTYIESAGSYDLLSNTITGGTVKTSAANTNDDYKIADNTRVIFTRSVYLVDADGNQSFKNELYAATVAQ